MGRGMGFFYDLLSAATDNSAGVGWLARVLHVDVFSFCVCVCVCVYLRGENYINMRPVRKYGFHYNQRRSSYRGYCTCE